MVKPTSLLVISLVPVVVGLPVLGPVAQLESPGAAASPPAATVEAPALQSAIDAESVVLQFRVRPDGSARAHVEYRLPLEDRNGTAGFDRLQRDVRTNASAYVDRFRRRVRDTASNAEAQTGRPMGVENVSVGATVEQLPQPRGVVTYTFTWHGFAAVDGRRLVVGDALAGLYLGADMRLIITWPDGYEPTRVGPTVHERRDGAAVWVGPRYFGTAGPSVVLAPSGLGVAVRSGNVPVGVVVGGLLALGFGVLWWRWDGADDVLRQMTPDRPSDAGSPVDDEVSGPGEPPSAAAAGAPPVDSVADRELLSNEEQVLWVLEQHDGRIKQQAVVETLGWSEAKVSRVVGRLREQERLETYRLGNENVLTFPGEGLL